MSCKCQSEVCVTNSCGCSQTKNDDCGGSIVGGAAWGTGIGACMGGPAGAVAGAIIGSVAGAMIGCGDEKSSKK